MTRIVWTGALLVLLALALPSCAWAMRCGTRIVQQGDTSAQVRDACGDPFYIGYYVGPPGVGVEAQGEPVSAVTTEVWYYNFGPQRLMVRLEFSGGVLAREETLGYGFVGRGGPCDFTNITIGMSVADLIARCGFPAVAGATRWPPRLPWARGRRPGVKRGSIPATGHATDAMSICRKGA
jgi:hypothetical protein